MGIGSQIAAKMVCFAQVGRTQTNRATAWLLIKLIRKQNFIKTSIISPLFSLFQYIYFQPNYSQTKLQPTKKSTNINPTNNINLTQTRNPHTRTNLTQHYNPNLT